MTAVRVYLCAYHDLTVYPAAVPSRCAGVTYDGLVRAYDPSNDSVDQCVLSAAVHDSLFISGAELRISSMHEKTSSGWCWPG